MINALPRVGKVDKADWTKAFKQIWTLAGGDAWKYNEETWGGAQRAKPKKSIELYLSYKQAPTAWLTYVADYIDTKGGDKIDDIGDTTKDKLQHAIFAGVEQEEGIPDIAKRVSDIYDGFEGYRATMIARSEVVEASNRASEQQVIDSGSELMMVWISTGDDRTRDEHLAMDDADPVPPGGDFDCADGTTFPGDAVNCRCCVGYVLPGGEAKPTESVLAERERRGEADYNDANIKFNEYIAGDSTKIAARDDWVFDYGPIQEVVRSGIPGESSIMQTIDILDNLIDTAPQYTGTVWRGIAPKTAEAYSTFTNLKVGEIFSDRGFMSTSIEDSFSISWVNAMSYENDLDRVVIKIIDAKGIAIDITDSLQKEVLLHRKTNLEVLSIREEVLRRGRNTLTIVARMVQ